MTKKALFVWGGWDGHTPHESAQVFAAELENEGFQTDLTNDLDLFTQSDYLSSFDLIVPVWTMGNITDQQWYHLDLAVKAGTGIAGWHGGIIDSFRNNTEYQWMTGGQWVAHPGNCIPSYNVTMIDHDHEITKGITDFTLNDTEQYYVHVDPAIHVLCTTTFTGEHGDPSLYRPGTVMPYAWTKTWGKGRVFVACWGHTYKDFDVPQAKELVTRGLIWAGR